MRKNLSLLIIFSVFLACSPRKNGTTNRAVQNFSTYYNTLFNSKDALEAELSARKKSHQDNFYSPYIQLLTYDEQPLGDIDGNSFLSDEAPVSRIPGTAAPQAKGATVLEISEAKAMKAIAKHSMMYDGEEKNKRIFDANILLAQARLYQNKYLGALDALNYILSNMPNDKRINLAKIYQGQTFAKMQDYARAEEVFSALGKEDLTKSEDKLLSIYHAELLLNSGKKEDAVAELDHAFDVNKNRTLRSRIAFLRGQILNNLGKPEEARESFVTAYKLANDFEFEVKSQVEIAKTFNGKDDDYEGAKKYLEDISKKGTYASRKNEFYYALGLMANKAGKTDEAKEFFAKSLKEKISDPQIRGLAFYERGKQSQKEEDYLTAGAYYDSAVAVMTYAPTKIALQDMASNIKNLTKNYYLIKKNDSILALTKMTEPERTAYFTKYIDALKAKEAKADAEKRKADRSKGFDTGDYNANSIFSAAKNNDLGFADISSSRGTFYFSNPTTVAKGQSEFRNIWGDRALQDNWRLSARGNSIDDLKNEAMGNTSAADPRRLQPDFYIEQIPTDAAALATLKKDRDTAALGLGRMYENYFSNTTLATKTLYDLADAKPEEDTKLLALYEAFSINYEKNPAAAERAKQMILAEFPYTSYAEFVKNPKGTGFTKSPAEVEDAYRQAFVLYQTDKFEESRMLIEQSLQKYPKDALAPKFALLNAYNTGKTAGKEIMILQLEQIALNYAKTNEGQKATELLKYLKSDLKSDLKTDTVKDTVENNAAPQPKPEEEKFPEELVAPDMSSPSFVPPGVSPVKNTPKQIKTRNPNFNQNKMKDIQETR